MAIFSRIADILKANINDMIDKAEDPEKMVKQLIIEIEQDVDEATQALGQAMGAQKMAAKELADAMAKSADWNDKAKLALKAGNEELARKALECKVGVDAQIEPLQKSYDEISANVNKMKDQVQTLRMKLDEARARQQVLIARSKMADAATEVAASINTTNIDSAFAKLDKLERKVVEKESIAEAYGDLSTAEVDANAQFAQMQHNAAIDSELERLKAEMGM
ncbi:MAG: PspA/IM30 family protein [Atopobiaceae bacterium]|nr:PspA/IM30 family protein [Atopobiaceae bacterium]